MRSSLAPFLASACAAALLVQMDASGAAPAQRAEGTRVWFKMEKREKTAEILIYDVVGKAFWGEETVSAKDFDRELKALGDVDQIILRINSPGGEVFEGVAIHNALRNHKATVTAHVDGIAASIASYIAMAADRIVMPANAFLLIHNASGLCWGTAEDMKAVAADLERINASIVSAYAARSAQPTSKIEKIMKEDRLMPASEALDLGLADEVTPEKKMAAHYSAAGLSMLPKSAQDVVKSKFAASSEPEPAPAPAPEKGPEPEPTPAPAPGPERSDPPTDPDRKEHTENIPRDPDKQDDPDKSKVVNLDDARRQGRDEYAKYVREVNDLCAVAGVSARRAADFIAKDTPLEQVRRELTNAPAPTPENRQGETVGHHPVATAEAAKKGWDKVVNRLNARVPGQR